MMQRKCASAQFAIRATSHSQRKLSPDEMAFGRNMLHPFSTHVNWDDFLSQKQCLVDKANKCQENSGRRFHDYQVNDEVLILNQSYHRGKLEPTTLPEGPWNIIQIRTNGTVSIQCRKYI